MRKNARKKTPSRGFTLIEVLVASVILSGVFFTILKLVSNNTYQATIIESSKTMDSLFSSSKACIQSFGFSTGTISTQSINFGANNLGCFTGSYDDRLSFTGISLERQNGTETGTTLFWNYFNIQNNSGILRVNNTITDGTNEKNYDFLLEK